MAKVMRITSEMLEGDYRVCDCRLMGVRWKRGMRADVVIKRGADGHVVQIVLENNERGVSKIIELDECIFPSDFPAWGMSIRLLAECFTKSTCPQEECPIWDLLCIVAAHGGLLKIGLQPHEEDDDASPVISFEFHIGKYTSTAERPFSDVEPFFERKPSHRARRA